MLDYYQLDNEIVVSDYAHQLGGFVEEQLTFPNPDYTKKARLGKYLGATPKEIVLYRVNGSELFTIPYGMKKRLENYIKEHNLVYRCVSLFKGQASITYPQIPLYDYQEKAVKEMVEAQGGILQAPAGSGKTQMGLSIVATLGKKTLWITHTKDLLNQTKQRAEEYWGSTLIGTITEGKVEIGTGLTIATVQTMANLDLSLYKNEWEVIIVDECHRVYGSATKVRQFQKVLENLSAQYQYGLSATIHRADGLVGTMFALIGDLAYTIKEEEVKDHIMRVSVYFDRFDSHITPADYLGYDGTLEFGKLITALTNSDVRNKHIIEQLQFNRFHSNLILSDRLEHLHTLYNMLPYKDRAVFIDGTMTSKRAKEQREQAIQDMRDGKKNFLFATYKLAKEGLDIPCLDRLYLTTPQKDYAIVVQSIGRIARTYESKSKPVVYDFVDADIPFLKKFYTERLRHYKREGCEIL